MALDVTKAIVAIQAIVRALPGMRRAPDYPPEQMNEFPFATIYLSSGEVVNWAFGKKQERHTVTLQIHVANKNLPTNVQDMMPYAESVPEALMALPDSIGGSGYHLLTGPSYRFGGLGWGDAAPTNTIGFSWTFTLEGQEAL